VEIHGASDFFPQPFEVRALRHSWSKVRPVLEKIDLLAYEPTAAIEMIAPKFGYTVRPVHLLDPVDLVLFIGLTFRFAPLLETKRKTYQQDRVFSNHFLLPRPGRPAYVPLVATDADRYRTQVNIRSLGSGAVATADVADFFARVYHHRLESAIAAIGGNELLSRSLMRFIGGWSHGTSYGIPTGPLVSNLLAESVLIEVDEYLLSMNIEFVRLADDYVLFGSSESECAAALHELGRRLLLSEGLTLNASKTRVWSRGDFRKLRVMPKSAEEALRRRIVDDVFGGDPYAHADYDELTPDQRAAVDSVDAEGWLEAALATEPADTAAIKFLLHFLSAFRRPELVEPILANLARLIPVSEAVGRFLLSLVGLPVAESQRLGGILVEHMQKSDYLPDFQAMWLLEPFVHSPLWNHLMELRQFAKAHPNPLVRRQAMLGISAIGDRSALVDLKLAFEGSTPWEARAIVFACRALPADERDAFFRTSVGGGEWTRANLLMRATRELATSTV